MKLFQSNEDHVGFNLKNEKPQVLIWYVPTSLGPICEGNVDLVGFNSAKVQEGG